MSSVSAAPLSIPEEIALFRVVYKATIWMRGWRFAVFVQIQIYSLEFWIRSLLFLS